VTARKKSMPVRRKYPCAWDIGRWIEPLSARTGRSCHTDDSGLAEAQVIDCKIHLACRNVSLALSYLLQPLAT
jgi:hypothetical protein